MSSTDRRRGIRTGQPGRGHRLDQVNASLLAVPVRSGPRPRLPRPARRPDASARARGRPAPPGRGIAHHFGNGPHPVVTTGTPSAMAWSGREAEALVHGRIGQRGGATEHLAETGIVEKAGTEDAGPGRRGVHRGREALRSPIRRSPRRPGPRRVAPATARRPPPARGSPSWAPPCRWPARTDRRARGQIEHTRGPDRAPTPGQPAPASGDAMVDGPDPFGREGKASITSAATNREGYGPRPPPPPPGGSAPGTGASRRRTAQGSARW